jgi:peroxiredoxin Q/BCP
VAYFMVSLDAPKKNKAFAESVGANFVLLSDPEKQASEAFGVLGFGGLFTKRWTFYIDPSGVVRKIDKDVNTSTHGEDIVQTLAELGFPKR